MSARKTQRVAVIGAGPIGLEAALAARRAGLEVVVMDAKGVGANVSAWGFVEMFTPWVLNTTPEGRMAAGDASILSSDQSPTGQEFVERYLLPLAQCEMLRGCIDTGVRVLAVGANGAHAEGEPMRESIGIPDRPRFSLLVTDRFGLDQMDHADIVLDCSGTYGNSRWTGRGGIPAIGEMGLKDCIWYVVPDVLGRDRARFADRHTLLIGTGTSAVGTLLNLGRLVESSPQTRVTWVFDRWGKLLKQVDEDPLRVRRLLTEETLRLTASPPAWLTMIEGAEVESISGERGLAVRLRRGDEGISCHVDEIVAAVGFRPDESLFAPLGAHPNYTSAEETHTAIETEMLARTPAVHLPPATGHLVSVVPGCYVLGAKSYGIGANFLLRVGHRQVRDVFREILGATQIERERSYLTL